MPKATGWFMDCDLQDRPEEIPTLYRKAQEGYDIVQGEREQRKDKFLKRMSSASFNAVFRYLSGIKANKKIANFGIYKQSVIDAVRQMGERETTFPFLVSYVGFKATLITIEHGSRFEGKSSYTLFKLLRLAAGTIISNTNKPLRMMVFFGLVLSFLSIAVALYNVLAYWLGFITVAGFTTTVFSIWFVGGMLMMQMGIVGIYIGEVFNQVKGRLQFIVKEEVNIEV